MKMVTIFILYGDKSGQRSMLGQCFAVSDEADVRKAFYSLADPLTAAGETIHGQLFVIAPDEIVAACAEDNDELRLDNPGT